MRAGSKKKRGARAARLVQLEESLVGSDYSADELELLKAMDRYMRATGARFPSFVEVLRVARGLGWVRDPAKALGRDPVLADFVRTSDPEPWDRAKGRTRPKKKHPKPKET